MYGGSSTHIPLKVNTGGVIPVIFASSILAFPATIAQACSRGRWAESVVAAARRRDAALQPAVRRAASSSSRTSTRRSSSIPDDVAENMRKYGGFIPGIRPGQADGRVHRHDPDADHAGGRDLPGADRDPAAVPDERLQVAPIPFIGDWLDASAAASSSPQGMNVPFYFGGTSLLIVVGVAMDTVQQVESQLIMRHYDGFMKKTRIRGRTGVAEVDGDVRLDDSNLVMLGPPGAGRARRPSGSREAGGSRRSRPATSCARRCMAGTEIGTARQGDHGSRRAGRATT